MTKQRPDYSGAALGARLRRLSERLDRDATRIYAQHGMMFATGSHYCCVEWGCHVPLHDEDMWRRLRRALTAIGAAPEEPMRARVTIAVERGALFFDVSRPEPAQRGRYAFAPMEARRYQRWIDEGDPRRLRT